jgi:DNA-binding MarR family transcriptional regulator
MGALPGSRASTEPLRVSALSGFDPARVLADRELREKHFPGVREAEWLMLCDLSAVAKRGRKLAVSDLQYGSFVPFTTMLRGLNRLSRKGLVDRKPDEQDKRRVWVSLSVLALEKLSSFAEAIADRSPQGGDKGTLGPVHESGGGVANRPDSPTIIET